MVKRKTKRRVEIMERIQAGKERTGSMRDLCEMEISAS